MKVNFSRLALFVLLAAVLLGLGLARPAPASADKSIKEPYQSGDFTVPAGVCGFAVNGHPLADKGYDKTHFIKGGKQVMDVITGVLKVRLTNADTGKSMDVNISGSLKTHSDTVHPSFNPDGSGNSDVTGPSLFWYFPDVTLPPLFTNSGHASFTWDAEGNLTSYSIKGHLIDMCQALSP